MLLGLLYDSSSSDLNLIVLHDKFFAMDIFLQQLAGYVTAEEQMEPHSSVAQSVSRFVRYRKSHLSFSLTQAGVIGPMRVWMHEASCNGMSACSNAIANMTFITAGWAATLYPEFTLCGKNIHRGHTQQIRGGENRIGSSKSDALALETDTSFLRGPCGRSCPSLWHSIATYGPYGVFNWDAC
jgi:hypothetical protein